MGSSGWTHAFRHCAGHLAPCPARSVWLRILGAPPLAGTPKATRPAGFGLLGAFRTLECVAGVKGQAVSRFWGDGEVWPRWASLPGGCPVWPAGLSTSSACPECPVDLVRRSSCSISDACWGSRTEKLGTNAETQAAHRGQADDVKQDGGPGGAWGQVDSTACVVNVAACSSVPLSGGRGLCTHVPSGPQFATVPSRSFPMHFPERWVPVARGSVSWKEHPESASSLWCCRRNQSPLTLWPRSKHPAQGVLCLMGWGESPAGRGGLSCTPQRPTPPSPCLCTARNTQLGPARPSVFRLTGSGRPCFALAGVLQSPPRTVLALRECSPRAGHVTLAPPPPSTQGNWDGFSESGSQGQPGGPLGDLPKGLGNPQESPSSSGQDPRPLASRIEPRNDSWFLFF